jgi:predicted RNA-binding Zn-ribbon protein involved in translation (DUF1610 family)
MGSSFESQDHLSFKNASEAEQYALDEIERSTSYNRQPYSGTWAEKNSTQVRKGAPFNSHSEAEDWIMDNNEKWGPLDVVCYHLKEVSISPPALLKKEKKEEKARLLHQKVRDGQNLHIVLVNEEFKKIKEQKSEYKGCSSCGSKLSVKHLKTYTCPLCQANLLSNTAVKRIQANTVKTEALSVKHKAMLAELVADREKLTTKSTETRWMIGGWCSE